eukprot:scaffold16556_cov133-Isochrysis_galbana.AAC.8
MLVQCFKNLSLSREGARRRARAASAAVNDNANRLSRGSTIARRGVHRLLTTHSSTTCGSTEAGSSDV